MVKYVVLSNRDRKMANSSVPETDSLGTNQLKQKRRIIILIASSAILLLATVVVSLIYLLSPQTKLETVARLRDIFIIFMALESLLIGIALIILMTQLSRLINLLNNEVKPILYSTNETLNTLRGTTAFLGNNLVEPVMKLNEYLAGMHQFFKIFNFKKKA